MAWKPSKPLEEMTDDEMRTALSDAQTASAKADTDHADALKSKETPAAPAAAAPAGSEQLTEEQWVALEQKFGQDRNQIQANWEMVNNVVAPIRQENAQLQARLTARDNVDTEIDKAKSSDKQFSKIESHVRSYMNDLPNEVKADPKQFAKQWDIAVKFGRGSVPAANTPPRKTGDALPPGVPVPAGGRNPEPPNPDDEDEITKAEREFFGRHAGEGNRMGHVRMNVKARVTKEYRDQHRHPEDLGVMIDHTKEWEQAVAPAGSPPKGSA